MHYENTYTLKSNEVLIDMWRVMVLNGLLSKVSCTGDAVRDKAKQAWTVEPPCLKHTGP